MRPLAAERPRLVGPRLARAVPVATTKTILSSELVGLELVAEEELELDTILREFPTIAIEHVAARSREGARARLVIDDFAWRGSFDFRRFDDAVEDARPLDVIAVRGDDSAGVACEVLGRYQRFISRRNSASQAHAAFDAVLTAHASLYDLSEPLAKAEIEHALDAWQWMLRLNPEASLPAQLAAVFHDVERIERDPQEKLEHRAPEHRPATGLQETQTRMARERVRVILQEAGLGEDDATHVIEILDGHERRAHEASILDEADALSFLSLESSRYADHFGLAQTRRKVTHTIGRLGTRAREKLALIRLRPDIDRLLHA